MDASPTVCRAPIETEQVGVLLANMLADWLAENRDQSLSLGVAHEFYDQRAASEQDRLCVCAAIDDGTGTPSSGEHRTAVRSRAEGSGAGLDGACGPDPGSRSGQVGNPDDGAGRLQDTGGG